MLNFDPTRFLRIQTGTVTIARDLGTLVGRLVVEGADSLFFMGSGGAGILMQPATDLMRRASKLPCHNVLCAEVVLTVMPVGARGAARTALATAAARALAASYMRVGSSPPIEACSASNWDWSWV